MDLNQINIYITDSWQFYHKSVANIQKYSVLQNLFYRILQLLAKKVPSSFLATWGLQAFTTLPQAPKGAAPYPHVRWA